jgi:hypothetical protein
METRAANTVQPTFFPVGRIISTSHSEGKRLSPWRATLLLRCRIVKMRAQRCMFFLDQFAIAQ